MKAIFVYVTAPNDTDAQKIAEAVVGERLAACANILPGMRSVYHWQGKIEQSNEVVVIFKTRADLFAALEKRVREMHSYQTPCIIALPISEGSEGFMKWIGVETLTKQKE